MSEFIEKMTTSKAKAILNIELKDLKLTPSDLRFLAVYTYNGMNAAKAVMQLDQKITNVMTAGRKGGKILEKRNIREALRRFVEAALNQQAIILKYNIIDIYYKRAFYSIEEFYHSNGQKKDISEINPDYLCCIDGVEEKFYGKDSHIKVTIYKLPDRDKALQHLWIYIKKYESITKDKQNDKRIKMPTKMKKLINQKFDISEYEKYFEKFKQKSS